MFYPRRPHWVAVVISIAALMIFVYFKEDTKYLSSF